MTWLIALIAFAGVILNVYKRPACFALWIVSNTAWAIVDWEAGLYAQSCLFMLYLGISIWGLMKWLKEGGSNDART
ncbi:MAG: nicotinamide mononucleotide transporter [Dehalococcoidales bacterium]|nr:nicotinamide mononucleotide transporter [Dehalococcoidales bacterium]